MPLYDYKCAKCGHIFEVLQKVSDEPLKYCPECKGEIRRLISPAGIIFKGSGFHVTDYGRSGKKEGGKKEGGKKETAKEPKSSAKDASPKKSE
jgi:putative FmdB family regulatory protein